MNRECTIVYFDNEIYGLLLEEDEYLALGGRPLANAFDNHHVQLVRAPSGQYQIVDDVNADAYSFVDGVNVAEQPARRGQVCAPWKLSAKQSDNVRDALEEAAT